MTPEEIAKLSEEVTEEIKKNLKTKMQNAVASSLEYKLSGLVNQEIDKFLKEQVAPEIEKTLLTNKDGIIKVALQSVDCIGEELKAAWIQTIRERMKQSYYRDQVVKALFGA